MDFMRFLQMFSIHFRGTCISKLCSWQNFSVNISLELKFTTFHDTATLQHVALAIVLPELLLPSPAWAEGTVLCLCVCVCVTTKLL